MGFFCFHSCETSSFCRPFCFLEHPFVSTPSASSQPILFQRGLKEFNAGEFYACHDTLEAVWIDTDTSEKPFYQGILQIAVAFYHLGNLNWRGGAILLGEGINRLRKFEPAHRGIDVEDLVDQAVDWLEQVQLAGESGLEALMADESRTKPKIKPSV